MKRLVFLGAWALIVAGCRKDVEEFRPYPESLNELSQLFQQVPATNTTTTFNFNNLNEDKILTTPSGIRVFLTDVDNLFAIGASPVASSTCQDLKVEITEAISKGDILARELPTITADEGKLVETKGMVRVRAWCSGTELQLMPGRNLKIQIPDSDPQDNLLVYTSVSDASGFKGWKTTGQEVYIADWPGPNAATIQGYELLSSELGWANCARPLANTGTPFCTDLQPSFTGLNTKTFLVFSHINVIAPLKFDDASHSFCFPDIPAGYPVKVVSVAKLGPDYWLGSAITETGTNSMLPLQSQKEDATDILGYLRGL